MTRINVVAPSELCDQHLLAEHRELTRIPNTIAKGKYCLNGRPDAYKLGTGHVKFFMDRLLYLFKRYDAIHEECLRRNFKVTWIWPDVKFDSSLWFDYAPTAEAIAINRARIQERMPIKARFTNYV